MGLSIAEHYAQLTEEERAVRLRRLSHAEQAALIHEWEGWWARPEQYEPRDPWTTWYIETGRGWGKTRTAAELIHKKVNAGHARYVSLVHRTAGDVRDVLVEGKSGLMATAKPGHLPRYEPTKRKLTWPNGATGTTYSAEEPDLLRGPEHDLGWGEEFATWKHITGIDGLTAFDNLRFSMRGTNNPAGPQLVLTTTPKRVPSVRAIHKDAVLPGNPLRILLTHGSLRDNLGNLDPLYVAQIMAKYAGTPLGEQEIEGKLAKTVEGAIFTEALLDASRVTDLLKLPELTGHLVAVDPSVGDGSGDECGISVQALSAAPLPTVLRQGQLEVIRQLRHGYVLDDASMSGDPDAWANKVCQVAESWGTTTVVAEGNQGGRMVASLIRQRNPALRVRIVHARVGKETRAQPVAGLFAQGRWHLVGYLPELEDQLTTWVPGKGTSPDRLDAMVWGATALEPGSARAATAVGYGSAALEHTIG